MLYYTVHQSAGEGRVLARTNPLISVHYDEKIAIVMGKLTETVAKCWLLMALTGCGPKVPTLVPAEWVDNDSGSRAVAALRVLTFPDDKQAELLIRFSGVQSPESPDGGDDAAEQLIYTVEIRQPKREVELTDAALLVLDRNNGSYPLKGILPAKVATASGPVSGSDKVIAIAFPIPEGLEPILIKETTLTLGFATPSGRLEQDARFIQYDRPVYYRSDYPGYWSTIDDTDRVYVTPIIQQRMPIMGAPKDPHGTTR